MGEHYFKARRSEGRGGRKEVALEFFHSSLLNFEAVRFSFLFLSSPEDMLIDFREKGREREEHPCERETSVSCLLTL